MYKIISFKTESGGGIGFLKADIKYLEDMIDFHNRHLYEYNCFTLKDAEWERCDNCFNCNLQQRIESYSIIGEISGIDADSLFNMDDKFYWEGGDCC